MRAEKASDTVVDRTITVRFDANVTPGMPWEFQPLQRTVTLKLGENALAFYKAHNSSDKPITGTASFNVSPDLAGGYFSKIECFCFKEQTLAPGESIDMPVSFFVDPSILQDRDAAHINEITLSYTFYPVTGGSAAAEVKAPQPAKGG
jgi:cytochrome c oxidase assembly protein subunit 11